VKRGARVRLASGVVAAVSLAGFATTGLSMSGAEPSRSSGMVELREQSVDLFSADWARVRGRVASTVADLSRRLPDVSVRSTEPGPRTAGAVPSAATVKQVQDSEDQRQAERKTPDAIAARVRSRTEFAAKTRDEALAVLRGQLGEQVNALTRPPLELSKGERVLAYTSPFTALIDGEGPGEGDRRLVQSSVPLRSDVGSGELEPVDPRLEERPTAFVPKNPVVRTTVAKDIRDGVSFGSTQLAVSAGSASDAPMLFDGSAVFANSGVDADTIVAAAPFGARFAWQLRSPDSPERLQLRFDMPDDATLTVDDNQQAWVKASDGRRLLGVRPPVALDADGQAVPVSYSAAGEVLTVEVQHQGHDLTYPLWVDPIVDRFGYDANGQVGCDDWDGWSLETSSPAYYGYIWCSAQLSANSGATYLGWGQWVYWTPVGRNAFVDRVDFRVSHTPNNSCITEGVWSQPRNAWEPGVWFHPPGYNPAFATSPWNWPVGDPNTPNYRGNPCVALSGNEKQHFFTPGYGSPLGRNAAVLQLWTTAAPAGNTQPLAALDAANVYLNDNDVPTFYAGQITQPTDWAEEADGELDALFDDAGLGVLFWGLRLPKQGGLNFDDMVVEDCTSLHGDWCPKTVGGRFDYDSRDVDWQTPQAQPMPEGINQVKLFAGDALWKTSEYGWPVRIDRSTPSLSLSGQLKDNAAQLPAADQDLLIDSQDGTRGGAASAQRSGVDHVDVLVDGKRVRRFSRNTNEWLLRNAHGAGGPDVNFRYGLYTGSDDVPVVGDWDGDGDATPGVFRRSTNEWILRNSNSAGDPDIAKFSYGAAGAPYNDLPVVGDWDGDGDDTIGVFRRQDNTWHLRNTNTAGADNISFSYGNAGTGFNDLPVVGDWDGDGDDTIGVFRRQDSTWQLRNTNSAGSANTSFAYGSAAAPSNDLPVVGDWDGDGDDTIGVFRQQSNQWYLRNTNSAGVHDILFTYGTSLDGSYDDLPIAGDWDGNGTTTAGIQERNCAGDSCPLTRTWSYRQAEQYGGDQTVKIVAIDKLGHKTEQDISVHRSAVGELLDPVDRARSAGRVPLRARFDSTGASTVRFQYRRPFRGWTDIPLIGLKDADGQPLGSTTQPLTGGLSPALNWDVPATFPLSADWPGSYEVRAVFPGVGVTKGASIQVDERGLSAKAAQATVGPGSVDLLTGNFSLSADDVSFATAASPLAVSRTYNSRDPSLTALPANVGVLGPGWTLTAPVDDAAADYAVLREKSDPLDGQWVEIVTSTGASIFFWKEGTDYEPENGFEDLALTKPAADRFELKDGDGNTVVFTLTSGEFVPTEVRQPQTSAQPGFKHLFSYATGTNGKPRITQIIAPREGGVTCASGATQPGAGCRALNFVYAAANSAGLSDTTWGDYTGRLVRIDAVGTTPGTSTQQTESVAAYSYDDNGRLRAAWDPRLPSLKQTYAYDTQGRLITVTPPGEAPWTLSYRGLPAAGMFTSDNDGGRLETARRTGPEGTAISTVVYRVPLSGTGAPYQMGKSDVLAWGQTDYAIDATAVFPPDQVPADPPASYSRAVVHYLGKRGLEVNTVAPGGHTTTTEYDVHDNVVRELSATNRQRVLTAGANSSLVDTQRTYSADGLRLLESLGPAHNVKLESGAVVAARAHTVTSYDEGAPTPPPGTPAPNLPTTSSTGAKLLSGGADQDVRVTKTEYDWKLRKPTASIVDPSGLILKRVTVYDPTTGRPTETRMPANPNGGDAHSTRTMYYTATGSGACVSMSLAGLPCRTEPAAQPPNTGLPRLPVTTYNYDWRLNPTTTTETVSSTTGGPDEQRVTTIGYDSAGRKQTGSTSSNIRQAGLVGAYSFDQGSGTTLADASGAANSGTIAGAAWSATGRFGKALDFDGVNDNVTVPESSTLNVGNRFTIEAWIRLDTLPAAAAPIYYETTNGLVLYVGSGGRLALRKSGIADIAISTVPLSTGTWQHVIATKDGTTTKLYIDGQDVTPASVTDQTIQDKTDGSTIGGFGTIWFDGQIDEVRIYNRAVAATEVIQDRDTAVATDTPDPLPTVTYGYSPTTGRPTTISTTENGTQRTITTAYDSLGRVSAYTDADGKTTRTAYDLLDRPTRRDFDSPTAGATGAKGWQTYTYNTTSGLLTGVQDAHAGAFTASYGADGQLLNKTYPNGMRADRTYDETGAPTDLSYVKTSNCASNCTWFADHAQESIHGQWLSQDGSLSDQSYRYDAAGRLTRVDDTVDAQQCTTTRSYSYDADSNRTDLTSRAAGEGACDTAAEDFAAPDEKSVNAGTYRGGVALGKAGALQGDENTAVALDGTDDTVRVASSASLSPTQGLSLEGWVRPTQLPASAATLARKEGQYLLQISSTGQVVFRIYKGGVRQGPQTAAGTIAPGNWYHLAATWDGTTMRIYVNGTQQATSTLGAPMDATANTLYLGSSFGTSDWLNGRLDELGIYDRALTQQTIQQHFAAAGQTPSTYRTEVLSTAGLLSYWRLGEGNSTSKSYTYDAADRLTGSGMVYDSFGRMATVPSTHAGGGDLYSTYYANDMIRSQTQGSVTRSWLLDPTLQRQRATVPVSGKQEVLHYGDDSDAAAWSEQTANGSTTSWTRNIEGIEGDLAATYDSQTATATLQLANLHGDIVATASLSATATGPTETFEQDEFGNPRTQSTRRYAWLGAKGRRTSFASGVVEMGVRSYVPEMGRFTSVDPIAGGSANAYDYANCDPVTQSDLDGRRPGTYQVKKCYASYGWGRIPLRYGNKRFGYRHIKARHGWGPAQDRLIANTLQSYNRFILDGDRLTLLRYRENVVSVVVVGLNPIPNGRDEQIHGVITAYKRRLDPGERRRGNLPPLSPGDSPACTG
jgi:RHS repeat-associated protein